MREYIALANRTAHESGPCAKIFAKTFVWYLYRRLNKTNSRIRLFKTRKCRVSDTAVL